MTGQTVEDMELQYEIPCYFYAPNNPKRAMKSKGGPFQSHFRGSVAATLGLGSVLHHVTAYSFIAKMTFSFGTRLLTVLEHDGW